MDIDVTKCRCWEYPFKPEGCNDYCSGRILREAKKEDLMLYLHINEPLADKIFELTSNESLVYLSHFKAHLTPEEYSEIDFQIKNMNPIAIQWLKRIMHSRVEAGVFA